VSGSSVVCADREIDVNVLQDAAAVQVDLRPPLMGHLRFPGGLDPIEHLKQLLARDLRHHLANRQTDELQATEKLPVTVGDLAAEPIVAHELARRELGAHRG
jgi:hypothetical protein